MTLLGRLVHPAAGLPEPMAAFGLAATVIVVVLCHLFAQRQAWQRVANRMPAPVLGACYALTLMLALLFAPGNNAPFIYFQF
jgi:hypothetical protein